jgi:hypothetical protein
MGKRGEIVADPRITTPDDHAAWGESAEQTEPIRARVVQPQPPPIVARVVEAGTVEQPIVGVLVADAQTEPDQTQQPPRGVVKRVAGFTRWVIRGSFCIASLVILLAVIAAIPVIQLIAFGYILNVAGRLASGGKLAQALPNLGEAGRIGLAAMAVYLAALPTQLLVHWESVAYLINPGSGQAMLMRGLAIASAVLTTAYLMWAWVRGGRLRDYLWPQPLRLIGEGWRVSTWSTAADRLWEFTASFQVPKLFWLGLRGAVGTLIWLVPAMIIIAAFRNGQSGLAGLVGFASLLVLGAGLMYLPMLQAHFAAENRMAALFEVRTIRRDFRRAPWAWLAAMTIGLVIMPIPLYLLKIEATPREVMWLPCLVFVAFILPARIAEGLALRRARRKPEPVGAWAAVSRWTVRALLLPAVVGVYLLFVYVSQYTSWDGLQTWVQQHAILIPVPYWGGV